MSVLPDPGPLCDSPAASLDPLGIDGRLQALCAMNSAADIHGLVGTLRDLVPSWELISELPLPGHIAVMRDLGMFLGSVKRCGVEPVQAIPELRARLLVLGARTRMVPGDTVFHYIGWNPTGDRERMFTGDPMERMLKKSVRITLPLLTSSVQQCRRLDGLEPGDLEFAVTANELEALLRSLEDAIDIVTENVTPEYFARTLRPYFEPVQVGSVDYLGPAAAHVPLYLVDLALWASDRGTVSYEDFWRESAEYGLPTWRCLFRQWAKGPSVVTRVTSALRHAHGRPTPPYLHASAEALCRALRALLVFRGKHLTVARRAYAEDIRPYPNGSGGASLQLLDEVTSLTRQVALSVRRSAGHGSSSPHGAISAQMGPRPRRQAPHPAPAQPHGELAVLAAPALGGPGRPGKAVTERAGLASR